MKGSSHLLLEGVEGADAVGFGQAVVLAAVDDEHRGRPLVYEVDRVVPTEANVSAWTTLQK